MSWMFLSLEGKYHVLVGIQDGTERLGPYDTEEEAQEHWRAAERSLNHRKLTRRDRLEVMYECEVTKVESEFLSLSSIQHWGDPERNGVITRLPEVMAHLLSPPSTEPGGTSSASESSTRPSGSGTGDETYRRIRRPGSEP